MVSEHSIRLRVSTRTDEFCVYRLVICLTNQGCVFKKRRQPARGMRRASNAPASMSAQQDTLFDHLVGAQQDSFRNCYPECFFRCQVDDQLESSRLLDWKVPGGNARVKQRTVSRL